MSLDPKYDKMLQELFNEIYSGRLDPSDTSIECIIEE